MGVDYIISKIKNISSPKPIIKVMWASIKNRKAEIIKSRHKIQFIINSVRKKKERLALSSKNKMTNKINTGNIKGEKMEIVMKTIHKSI